MRTSGPQAFVFPKKKSLAQTATQLPKPYLVRPGVAYFSATDSIALAVLSVIDPVRPRAPVENLKAKIHQAF
jgi:hypothetical protein